APNDLLPSVANEIGSADSYKQELRLKMRPQTLEIPPFSPDLTFFPRLRRIFRAKKAVRPFARRHPRCQDDCDTSRPQANRLPLTQDGLPPRLEPQDLLRPAPASEKGTRRCQIS